MWNTQEGVRVLKGAEWELFRLGIALLWDDIEQASSNGTDTRVTAFDGLQQGQQLAILAEVGRALSDEAIAPPTLTACNESTIAALFNVLREYTACECETCPEDDLTFRQKILDAYLECEAPDPLDPDEPPIPAVSCEESDEWLFLIDILEERILWDHDYEMGHVYLDLPSEFASAKLKEMGISRDYFTDVPADPTEKELKAVCLELKMIIGSSP